MLSCEITKQQQKTIFFICFPRMILENLEKNTVQLNGKSETLISAVTDLRRRNALLEWTQVYISCPELFHFHVVHFADARPKLEYLHTGVDLPSGILGTVSVGQCLVGTGQHSPD